MKYSSKRNLKMGENFQTWAGQERNFIQLDSSDSRQSPLGSYCNHGNGTMYCIIGGELKIAVFWSDSPS